MLRFPRRMWTETGHCPQVSLWVKFGAGQECGVTKGAELHQCFALIQLSAAVFTHWMLSIGEINDYIMMKLCCIWKKSS